MQQAFWKRILSYFVELHIESVPTDINPHLYVSLNSGRYQLCTANAVYSFDDLYTNFSRAFVKLDITKYDIDKALILGFGMGSIPLLLERKFERTYEYTAVELDEGVIYLANKYTLSRLHSPVQIVCADAFAYAFQCQEQFDLICMDVFLDDTIPDRFKSEDYLVALRHLLRPKGLLLYNCLAATPADVATTKQFYESVFLSVFPNAHYFDVGGNWMLIGKAA